MLLWLALVTFLSSADAQQSRPIQRVGVLNFGTPAYSIVASPINERLVERLAELGYRKGENLVLEYRFAEGRLDRVPALTREFVQLKVDVIVTIGNRLQQLVTEANPHIPLVSASCDSHSSVARYARPNGNFTGVTCMSTELSPKRLELVKQIAPGASRVVYLHNPNQGAIGLELTLKAASRLGLAVRAVEARSSEEMTKALASIAADRPDVLLVYPDALTMRHRREIADFALAQRLPSIFAYKEYADAGGLVSYGSTLVELGERAAELVARLLRGTKPHELPIEQATRIYLTVNLKTARQLGQTIPTVLLQRADFVIE
jgi:putative ABC transport system substrate-binding protein